MIKVPRNQPTIDKGLSNLRTGMVKADYKQNSMPLLGMGMLAR